MNHLRKAWRQLIAYKARGNGIPPAPGESPLPGGTYRMFHVSPDNNLESIRRNGLTLSTALGNTYGEPDLIWFSNRTDYFSRGRGTILVEVAIPKDKVDNNLAVIGGPNGNMAVPFDVPPSWIIAIHENWHFSYRYLDDRESRQRVLDGFYDDVGPDTPDEYRAIQMIKSEGL